MKRLRIVAAALVCLAAAPGPVRAAEESVTFTQGWLIQGTTSPFFAAIDLGYYKKANLNVNIARGFGSADTAKKVASGAVPYGIADAGVVVVARSRGAKIKLLALETAQSQYAWFALKGSGISTPKDLEGKTTGTPEGDLHKTLFPALAKINHIDSKKLRWITLPPTAMIGSLITGKIDAMPILSIVAPIIRAAAQKAGKEIVMIPWANWGIDIYSLGLIATDERIAQNPGQVRRFVDASVRGIAWAVEHPGRAAEILKKYNPEINVALARANWEINIDSLLTPEAAKIGISKMGEVKMTRTRDLMTQYSNLPAVVPVKDLYTNEFTPVLFPKRGK
ncbi:MAG: ABC transporter substrate-binding protein [Candidatus Tectomicrobia bacterium]|nr:ABC transporter substrate-binding protein [Candidatus Tectomicrobia bacterium]